MGLLITWGNVAFFLISSMVLGLPDQVQIFSLWYLIELLGLLTGLGLLKLWHLIYPRLLTGFGMLVYFTNLGLGEFPVRCLALFLLFSVVDSLEWFWMEILQRSFLLVLEFLKRPFLVLHLKKNFISPFYGWGSTASRLEPLRGGSLIFTSKFPEIPCTHFIDLGRMKG